MKNKVNVRFIIFIGIILLVLALAVFGIIKGVSGKKAGTYKEITPEEYSKIASKEGYNVNDITESLSSYSYIKSAVMAVSQDGTYEIEYYKFEDEKTALNFVNNKKMAISMLTSGDSTVEELAETDYFKYAEETDTYYCLVFKIGTTVVCSDVKLEQKEDVVKVFQKLGYMN